MESLPLGLAVAEMYTDLRVGPLLHRLLIHSRGLLDTVAGSISLIDTARGRYDKIAENGVACRLGQSFPLDEGATGPGLRPPHARDHRRLQRRARAATAARPPGRPRRRGRGAAVVARRGDRRQRRVRRARRRFTTAEVDAFELLTQSVASAVVKAGAAVPSLAGLLREHGRVGGGRHRGADRRHRGRARAAGPGRGRVGGRGSRRRGAPGRRAAGTGPSRLHVAVVHRPEGVRLLVQDETTEAGARAADPLGLGTHTWNELLAMTGGGLGGTVGVEHVAGWGTLLRADFPDRPPRRLRPRRR